MEQPHDTAELFHEALALSQEERAAFLSSACRDKAQREAIERLLRADDRAPGGFLPESEAPDAAELAGTKIAGYELLRRLGEGGMGTVWAARQEFPRREVALKRIRPERLSPRLRARFATEVQALGSLHHPGIAQIFDAGTVVTQAGGARREEPYLVMELVDGAPLLQHAEERGLGVRERLALVARIADAVHHAHQRGVIHRDLKPENVLVVHGEAEASEDAGPIGQPKILDFGIARLTRSLVHPNGDDAHTRDGELVGTLAYMSPEQMEGAAVDERTDVHALGVLAYLLLSGELPRPLDGLGLPAAVRRMRDTLPRPLAERAPELRGDPSTIVARALAPDPVRRYASAGALAADIRRFLRGAPIEARSDSTLYVLSRKARRHRLLLGTAGTLAVAGLALVLQLRKGQALARESDRNLEQALESITRFERFSSEHFQQSPEQYDFLSTVLERQSALLEGREENGPGRVAHARTRTIVAILSHVLGRPEAREELQAVVTELEGLLDDTPSARSELVYALKELAFLHEQEGRTGEAGATLERLLEIDGVAADWRASAQAHQARLARGAGLRERAMTLYRAAIAGLEGEPRDFDSLAHGVWLDAHCALGSMTAEDGRLDEASALFRPIEELRDELDRIESPVLQNSAVNHLANLAVLEGLLERPERSLVLLEEARALAEELVATSPNHKTFRRELQHVLSNTTAFLANQGRFEEAKSTSARAMELARGLYRELPGAPKMRGHLGLILVNRGLIDMELGAMEAARSHLDEALELLPPAIDAVPGQVEWPRGLREARLRHVECRIALGEHALAVDEILALSQGLLEGSLDPELDPGGWRRLALLDEAVAAALDDAALAEQDRAIVVEAYVERAIELMSPLLDDADPQALADLRDRERFGSLAKNATWTLFLELLLG